MNPELLHILQHSLGADQYGRMPNPPYRNRFVTGPGSKDLDKCNHLVKAGFMKDHGASQLAAGDRCFSVTDEGKVAMREHSPQPPKLTRSQQRYQRFLKTDCGMTFRDFLRIKERV